VAHTSHSYSINTFPPKCNPLCKKKPPQIVDTMPIATPQGTLDFKSVDKVTFVGASSNTVIDTITGSLGVGVDVNGPTSNLHVVGHTRLEGDINMLHTSNTASIKLNSNVVTEFPRSKKLIKYPRVVLTANGLNQGYTVSGSSEYSSGLTYYGAFTPPTPLSTPSGAWLTPTSGTTGYDTGTGDYLLSAQLHSDSLTGEYVQIVLPERINPVYFTVQPRPESANNKQGLLSCIKEGEIWASNSNDSGTTWTLVGTIQNFIPTSLYQQYTVSAINATGYYDTFALIIHKNNGQVFAGVGEWQLYGVPEYDPDANGVNVMVKSLPNVPNTDWLDIYIDGQDYSIMPSGNGSVLDKSTNNRHGTPSNVTFNSTWKAFEIESASTSNITVPFNSTGGAYVHTIALWFLMDTTAGGNRCIFTIRGSESTGKQIALIINQDSTSVGFKYDFYGADIRYYDPSVVANKWMHVALTYSGGNNSTESKEIYFNGVKLGVTVSGTSSLNLTGTENLIIGGNLNSGNASFEGMVANFRMFNRVLTSDEIYQLYAYQKEYFGHGDLGMTLKAGRLGIGTSEPRVALDVRGDIYGGCPIYFAAYNTNGTSAGNTVIWNELWISRGGGYDTGTGIFTAPLAGIYKFYYTLRQSGGGSASLYARVQLNGSDVSNNYGAIYLSTTRDQAGSTVLFKLNAGDEISVKVYGYDMASAYSSFVGEYFSSL
jgi:hypothetical protein